LGAKILIVDDSPTMQRLIRSHIRSSGFTSPAYQLETASNCEEGLRLARNWKPDLIILDWHLPDGTGGEIFEQLRAEGIDAKVGFVTSMHDPEVTKKLLDEGIVFFLNKPFTVADCRNAMSTVFSSKSPLPSLDAVRDMLEALLDTKVTVARTVPIRGILEHPMMVGIYRRKDESLFSCAVMDTAAANRLSAAFARMPEGGVQGTEVSLKLLPGTATNAHEIFNVCTGLLVGPDWPGLHVAETVQSDTSLSFDVHVAVERPAQRLDMHVTIGSYGSGVLAFLLA
jgi:CheY-like chemotaxis protein